MPTLLILSTNKTFCDNKNTSKQVKDKVKKDETGIFSKINTMFDCLDCPDCRKLIIENLHKFDLHRLNWEPVLFRRNALEFVSRNKGFDFKLMLKVVNPSKFLVEHSFATTFLLSCDLIVFKKMGVNKGKVLKLLDYYEYSYNSNNTNKVLNEARAYIDKSFGIDFFKWFDSSESERQP